jgi:hypothetical protein
VAGQATEHKDVCNVAERMTRMAVSGDQPSSTLCKNVRKFLVRIPVVTANRRLLGNVSTMHVLAAVVSVFEESETEQNP